MNAASVKQSARRFVYARPVLRDTWLNLNRLMRRLRYLADYGVWDWCFDRWQGTDTAGLRSVVDLTLRGDNGAHALAYLPVRPWIFKRALRSLPINLADYCFVDLGSGKGRAVFLAAHWPFKRLVGIEFAKELHDAAQKNILGSLKHRRPIQLVWADILDFHLPLEPCVLYLFHPFGIEMMRKVLSHVRNSLIEHPRDVILIYVNPENEAAIRSEFPNSQLLSAFARKHRYVTYRLNGPDPGQKRREELPVHKDLQRIDSAVLGP